MADSEVRQKFEARMCKTGYWKPEDLELGEDGEYTWGDLRECWNEYSSGFEAGMRAGEIARSEFVIDLLGKRITRILEVGRAENDGEDYGQSHCFHLMEIQRILRGEKTCGVYDDYGRVPAAPEEKKPALSGAEESKKENV